MVVVPSSAMVMWPSSPCSRWAMSQATCSRLIWTMPGWVARMPGPVSQDGVPLGPKSAIYTPCVTDTIGGLLTLYKAFLV